MLILVEPPPPVEPTKLELRQRARRDKVESSDRDRGHGYTAYRHAGLSRPCSFRFAIRDLFAA